ncbi:MAG: hypothetical protein GXP55_13175 [Deltaproteobacteria bacterium]|nr:hypothetical protein [Deltaproteobacteria bacterium]
MERDTILRMLSRVEGVELSDDAFEVAEGHGLTFYLGGPGDAMVVREIHSGVFDADFVELVTEDGEHVYSPLDSISALATKPPRDAPSRRAGFA